MSTKPTLSEREMEVLALAWQCMETQPKVRRPILQSPPIPLHFPLCTHTSCPN